MTTAGSKRQEDETGYFAEVCTVALSLALSQDTSVGKGLFDLTCAFTCGHKIECEHIKEDSNKYKQQADYGCFKEYSFAHCMCKKCN